MSEELVGGEDGHRAGPSGLDLRAEGSLALVEGLNRRILG
jgi:hypothetical protein